VTKIRPASLVFDLDGTLIDGYRAIEMALSFAMTTLGFEPWGAETVRRNVGRGLEALLADAIGPDLAGEGVRLFRTRYPEVYLDHSRLLPEVESTIRELGRRGYRMGVATNKPARFSRELIRHLGLAAELPFCWGPDLVSKPKPDPEMVFRLLEQLEALPETSLYVGDMPVDVSTARAAGVPVWVVPTGSSTRGELETSGANAVLERFSELTERLEG
jgi:phosphoglycolate phosphatase